MNWWIINIKKYWGNNILVYVLNNSPKVIWDKGDILKFPNIQEISWPKRNCSLVFCLHLMLQLISWFHSVKAWSTITHHYTPIVLALRTKLVRWQSLVHSFTVWQLGFNSITVPFIHLSIIQTPVPVKGCSCHWATGRIHPPKILEPQG